MSNSKFFGAPLTLPEPTPPPLSTRQEWSTLCRELTKEISELGYGAVEGALGEISIMFNNKIKWFAKSDKVGNLRAAIAFLNHNA
tara:strand:+ start:218 stop:472 length:255 start_codon:yes stop_codon:yes gene_type:complete